MHTNYAHKFYVGRFWNYASQSQCVFAVSHVDRVPACCLDVRRIVAVSVREAKWVYSLLTGE
jgi:hypothetical protein